MPRARTLEPSDELRLFMLKIRPMLEQRCGACHGSDPATRQAELNLLSQAGWQAGGESGEPLIADDDVARSLILRAVRWDDLEMPPKANDRLSEQEITWLETWIEAGAH
ncbi:MAG: c-type cytochrome domain-containing protein [Pirellulaceae bacterium]